MGIRMRDIVEYDSMSDFLADGGPMAYGKGHVVIENKLYVCDGKKLKKIPGESEIKNVITLKSKEGLSLSGTGATFDINPSLTEKGNPLLRVTASSGNNADISINPCGHVSRNGSFALKFFVEDLSTLQAIEVLICNDTIPTQFARFKYQLNNAAGAGQWPALKYNGWHVWRFSANSPTSSGELSYSGGAFSIPGTPIHRIIIRTIPVTNSGTSVNYAWLDTNPQQEKAKFIITADDTYDNWYTKGIAYLDKLGLKSTSFHIADGTGSAGRMTLAQLQNAYANGHDISVHGGSNLTTLSNPATRYNDVKANRDYLINNGMPRGADHYAWPNGAYEMSDGDVSLRDCLLSNSIKSARGTVTLKIQPGSTQLYSTIIDPAKTSKMHTYSGDIMNLPIIGHDGTADIGTTQLQALLDRIDRVVTDKASAILMFHHIRETPIDSLTCPYADFKSICDRIKFHKDAGNAVDMTMSMFYDSLGLT